MEEAATLAAAVPLLGGQWVENLLISRDSMVSGNIVQYRGTHLIGFYTFDQGQWYLMAIQCRVLARELAQVLARVSNRKGQMNKLLKWLYCGLKILARELSQFQSQFQPQS